LQPQHGKTGVWLAVVLVSLGLTGQVVHVWADATSYVPVTQFTRVLPLYYPLKAKRSLMKFGLLDEAEMQRLRSINLAKIPDGGQLNYPLAPLQFGNSTAKHTVCGCRCNAAGSYCARAHTDIGAVRDREFGFPQSLQRRQFIAHGLLFYVLWNAEYLLADIL
jgi:hypothetical protein